MSSKEGEAEERRMSAAVRKSFGWFSGRTAAKKRSRHLTLSLPPRVPHRRSVRSGLAARACCERAAVLCGSN